MTIKIRKATLKDLEEIKKLNQELFNYDFKFDKTLDLEWPSKNKDYYKKRITGKDSITLIAEDEKKIVGYLIGVIVEGEGYRNIKKIAELENMFISENYRRKGIGKSLIINFINWAKGENVKKIKVVASAKNNCAIELYKKSGFSDHNLVLEANT